MSSPGGRAVLVLGGIGSGRSRYAESLLAGAGQVRRITGGGDLADLVGTLAEAKPDETVLVDGLDAWVTAAAVDTVGQPAAALAAAVRDSAARLVLVSSEVGLSVPEPAGREAAEAIGALNHAVAAAVDEVVLVVAGQPVRLRGGGSAPAAPVREQAPAAGGLPDESRLTSLPTPDEQAGQAAAARMAGAGLGTLAAVVSFAAATQGTATPAPWRTTRLLMLRGDHAGAASAGAAISAAQAAELERGTSALAQLAGQAGVAVHLVETGAVAPLEDGLAMTDAEVEQALGSGWRLAEQAVDEGVDLIMLGAIGDGAATAAAAVAAAMGGQSAEAASLLGRVRAPDGTIDDEAWIRRCAALRDAVYRARSASRTGPRAVLAELGGADLATATGVVLGAAARRTPVAIDGPVGAAAALVARQLGAASRRWCLLADHGGQPTVVRAATVLGLTPLLDLKLALGEGATTLAALPLLRSALLLAAPDRTPTLPSI